MLKNMLYQDREIIKIYMKKSIQYRREGMGISRMVLMGGTRNVTVQQS